MAAAAGALPPGCHRAGRQGILGQLLRGSIACAFPSTTPLVSSTERGRDEVVGAVCSCVSAEHRPCCSV